ncbi:MAG TPA: HAMP domain-containing histidine kinase [Candidatus Borkfalkia stercoripullorum]|nr:HAMP domain-containing histidine kinase [Candidatus Borkfalkia stercoripullorum]
MKGKRLRSINFILWISFLAFAAFILIMTWVFQTTLLRQFFISEVKADLEDIGGNVYRRISELMRAPNVADDGIDVYIALEQYNNPSVNIYVLDESGDCLYPTEMNAPSEDYNVGVDQDVFNVVFEELCNAGTDKGVIVRIDDGNYVYSARFTRTDGQSSDNYLYINYSTELSESAFSMMEKELIVIAVVVVFVALIISALLSMELTRPIARFTRAARRMAKGDFTVDFKGEYTYAEMDALAETLDYAKEEIGKSDQLQKEVLANVTHDLKTPLTMIKAYASMIQEISGDNPEKRAKHTQVIIDESDRLTALVNDILNLSKIRSGMDSLKLQEFNLSEFIHTVLERFDYLTETKGYTLVRDIDDELYTEADTEKLEQVVYNLVGNAVNYTGEDKKITVSLKKAEGGKIRFSVTDTGKGIPPDEIDTIWDRYYRSTETHKRPIKGTGLGLSIVKTILVKHGFEYGVESEVGKGSTFYVLFPEK